jgi:septal ring factor EnvC (AmiA/AmiB activator)
MTLDINYIIIAILAAVLSGMGTAIIAGLSENKKEKIRQKERDQDHLKLELKDLKIELYKLEKELTQWKDRYYDAIQELISVKSELENALSELSHIEFTQDLDTEF